jgi:hypothetical protein
MIEIKNLKSNQTSLRAREISYSLTFSANSIPPKPKCQGNLRFALTKQRPKSAFPATALIN